MTGVVETASCREVLPRHCNVSAKPRYTSKCSCPRTNHAPARAPRQPDLKQKEGRRDLLPRPSKRYWICRSTPTSRQRRSGNHFLAVWIWLRRYLRAASSCLSSNFLTSAGLSLRWMISVSRRCSKSSSCSRAVSLMTLFGTTPQSSSSLPEVLDLLRFFLLGRQKVAVVSLISPPSNSRMCWTLPLP